MKYKIGDLVICIKEGDLPNYIGGTWEVIGFGDRLIYCKNIQLYASISTLPREGFPFWESEIVLASSLIKELV